MGNQTRTHIIFFFQQIEANAETRDDGPPKIIFSIYRPTVLKRESSPPLLHTPKFLAHDEKHTSSRVALSFCRALKKLEVGRAAFRTPPSTPPGRLLSPPCSQNNPHKVSIKTS